ncbi:MAG TPA: hypothetical protein VLA83_10310, partial [Candidatus Binatia bacterium]|nr:hypothetical protein [Candidatus Binatia bacterium]
RTTVNPTLAQKHALHGKNQQWYRSCLCPKRQIPSPVNTDITIFQIKMVLSDFLVRIKLGLLGPYKSAFINGKGLGFVYLLRVCSDLRVFARWV